MAIKTGNLDMDNNDIIKYCINSWNDITLANLMAKTDRKCYKDYKKGEYDNIPNEKLPDMIVLSGLEALGYPMDELGTYLYKTVVLGACSEMKDIDLKDMVAMNNLILELNVRTSEFYHNLARNELEMGVKTFHSYIIKAVESINADKINAELESKIFGDTKPASYGTQAFKIALYLNGKNKDRKNNKVSSM